MKALVFIGLLIAFSLGWLLSDVYIALDWERPSIVGYAIAGSNDIQTIDRLSPSDIISQEQIRVYSDRVVIYIDNPRWATFTDTKSMDPVIDSGAFALQIVPERPEQIHEGDIISFRTPYADGVIIHRVIETGVDEFGWYARTKGDNNPAPDPGKVRFESITKQLFGIIY
ncbi:MAG: signal peptidase I [Candidatus Woesearchaeota archaeon]